MTGMVFKGDRSDRFKSYGQAESRGTPTAGSAAFQTPCDAGAGKGQGDSRGDGVQGTKFKHLKGKFHQS